MSFSKLEVTGFIEQWLYFKKLISLFETLIDRLHFNLLTGDPKPWIPRPCHAEPSVT